LNIEWLYKAVNCKTRLWFGFRWVNQMKKTFKCLGIIILLIIVGIIVLFVCLANSQSAPKEYWSKINTEAAIEKNIIV